MTLYLIQIQLKEQSLKSIVHDWDSNPLLSERKVSEGSRPPKVDHGQSASFLLARN